jgi:putative oxidoreductase
MKTLVKTAAPALLVLLFVYASVSKLADVAAFRGQLHNQNLPGWMAEILLYTLIPIELFTAGLLAFAKSERAGLWCSVALLSVFSGYMVLVLLHFRDRVPCSCGGILTGMSWGTHLAFNVFFLLLALAALAFPENEKELT